MKIALISDIHGNLPALDAVLKDINKQKADRIICLGDVATIGPQPLQVLERLMKLKCDFIMGNHDATLLQPDAAAHYQIGEPLWPMLNWCGEQISEKHLNFLRTFRPVLEVELTDENILLCFHGSPNSNTDNIYATTPGAEVENLIGVLRDNLLAGGHTHIQMLRKHHGKTLINTGSVGCAFRRTPRPDETPELLPQAEYAVVEINNKNLSVDLKQVHFDTQAYKKIIAESGNPLKGWLLAQY
ncbi:MAG: metallophosphoesterase family protein [Calditrichaeota bacterium]|nr:metallophosphoesterase family protein [Calditrichota bacterium]